MSGFVHRPDALDPLDFTGLEGVQLTAGMSCRSEGSTVGGYRTPSSERDTTPGACMHRGRVFGTGFLGFGRGWGQPPDVVVPEHARYKPVPQRRGTKPRLPGGCSKETGPAATQRLEASSRSGCAGTLGRWLARDSPRQHVARCDATTRGDTRCFRRSGIATVRTLDRMAARRRRDDPLGSTRRRQHHRRTHRPRHKRSQRNTQRRAQRPHPPGGRSLERRVTRIHAPQRLGCSGLSQSLGRGGHRCLIRPSSST